MKKKYNWELLYLVWLKKNLDADQAQTYTYRDLGEEYNIPPKTIRNRASVDKWQDKLDRKRSLMENKIISNAQSLHIDSETEIRHRHAQIAKNLMGKAVERIDRTNPEDLTHKQALDILKFALPEERKALGLADKYEFKNTDEKQSGGYLSVEERKRRIQQVDALATQLIDFLESEQNAD